MSYHCQACRHLSANFALPCRSRSQDALSFRKPISLCPANCRPVHYTAIFSALQQTFGQAASRKSTGQKIMGLIEALAQGNSTGGGGGVNAYGARGAGSVRVQGTRRGLAWSASRAGLG